MNDLEKLLWALDPTGSAQSFTLTTTQLVELLDASYDVGFELAEAIYMGA